MRRRARLGVLALALSCPPAWAHVGSPNVIFEGLAGTYAVRVIVRPPDVVPGLADVTVRLLEGGAEKVTVQPFWWWAPKDGGAPPPDVAAPVRGEPSVFTGSLWLMTAGSYAVRVAVTGAQGTGEVLVPVVAVPARALAMPPAFGALLLALGVVLYAGSVSIIRAAVGEAVLPPGAPPGSRRRRSIVAASIAAVVIGLALFGLWRWWGAVDAAFRGRLYAPPRLVSGVHTGGNGSGLRVSIDDEGGRRRQTPLALDHGKLMHLFLIREPGHDVLAHLHPAPVRGQQLFEAALPPLPGGRYRLFADVTHESGFSQTLTDVATLPDPAGAAGAAAGDPDDSFFVPAKLLGAQPYPAAPIGPDGFEIRQEPLDQPLVAGRELKLRFRLAGPDGQPVMPEPYMGMAGHAVVLRDDASVFIHLHPTGTISMASQRLFDEKLRAEAPAGHVGHAAAADPILAFPYAFPREGRYRVFVQAKAAGLVRTGAFDLTVAP
jgi:hypothetical protein